MKLSLSIISTLLFPLSFWICKYFHPEAFLDINNTKYDTMAFTNLRYTLYAVICILWAKNSCTDYTTESIKIKRLIRLFSHITMGLCGSDIIDRFIFNITIFDIADIIMIGVTLIFSLYIYFRRD
jgi:hypothetical protein